MIREGLAGRRIAVTGATGFLGTALVERLLRAVPDCELVLIVRPGRRGATARVERDILRNDAFDRLRDELGKDGFAETTARRVHAVAGDVGTDGLGLDDAGRALLGSCDVVIHSAAAVSFAGSRHEVDQPHHLHVADTDLCASTCITEYGAPCENFCPAFVYEMIDDDKAPNGKSLVIHHENCVHCKTCDIADPYAQITWTTPEGGDGPDYTLM